MKVLVLCAFIAVASGALAPLHRVSERVPGNYMVKIKKDIPLDDFITKSFTTSIEGRVLHKYEHIGHGIAVRIPDHLVDVLRSLDGVEYIAEDGVVYTQQGVASWGLDRVDQRYLPLDNKFEAPRSGAGSTVYVLDTGVRHSHMDFGGRASNLWDYEPNNGGADCNGHGTHCSGTAAGATFGVAKDATIKSVRFLGCSGSGLWTDMLDGLDVVVADTSTTKKVASMSVGGGYNPFVDQTIKDAVAAGVVVSVAAGNDNSNACNYSPSGVPEAITVGASGNDDSRASYSNYGSCVDLFAPGTSIVSTWMDSDTDTATLSGTSMSCPHVSGAAALLLDKGVAPANIQAEIAATATKGVVTDPQGSPNLMLYLS